MLKKKHFDYPHGSIMKHLREFVTSVPEYRRICKGNFKHKLEDILMLIILGRLSKCITRAELIEFDKRYLNAFTQWVLLGGLSSEATFCRVFKSIDDEAMSFRMSTFSDAFRKEFSNRAIEIICMDGEAMRGTVYENGRNPDIVSACSLNFGMTLATDVYEEKSYEIKSVPRLLDKVDDVRGCIVTADAMSFQKSIVDKIRKKGGDFVIELKANQKSLRYGLEDRFRTESPSLEYGRIESRTCRIYRGEELIVDREKWNGRLTVIEILTDTEKKYGGQSASEQRLYISNLDGSAKQLGLITGQHWSIESMHWDLNRNLR